MKDFKFIKDEECLVYVVPQDEIINKIDNNRPYDEWDEILKGNDYY